MDSYNDCLHFMNESNGYRSDITIDMINDLYEEIKYDCSHTNMSVYTYTDDNFSFPDWLYRIRLQFNSDKRMKQNAVTYMAKKSDNKVLRLQRYADLGKKDEMLNVYNTYTDKMDVFISINKEYFQNNSGSKIRSTLAHELRHCYDTYILGKLDKQISNPTQDKVSYRSIHQLRYNVLSERRKIVALFDKMYPRQKGKFTYDIKRVTNFLKYTEGGEIGAYYQGDMAHIQNINIDNDARLEYEPKIFLLLKYLLWSLLIIGDYTKDLDQKGIVSHKVKQFDDINWSALKLGFLFKHSDFLDRLFGKHPNDTGEEYPRIAQRYLPQVLDTIYKRFRKPMETLLVEFNKIYDKRNMTKDTALYGCYKDISSLEELCEQFKEKIDKVK